MICTIGEWFDVIPGIDGLVIPVFGSLEATSVFSSVET
jgi:hypothetical protein